MASIQDAHNLQEPSLQQVCFHFTSCSSSLFKTCLSASCYHRHLSLKLILNSLLGSAVRSHPGPGVKDSKTQVCVQSILHTSHIRRSIMPHLALEQFFRAFYAARRAQESWGQLHGSIVSYIVYHMIYLSSDLAPTCSTCSLNSRGRRSQLSRRVWSFVDWLAHFYWFCQSLLPRHGRFPTKGMTLDHFLIPSARQVWFRSAPQVSRIASPASSCSMHMMSPFPRRL